MCQCPAQIRQSAGLLLKNNLIRQYVGTPPDYQEYIKVSSRAVPCHIRDPRCTLARRHSAELEQTILLHAAQASLLLAIDNEARALRHVVGTNVATIVAADGLGGWPQLLPSLVRCLQSDSVAAIEGALDALSKVTSSDFSTLAQQAVLEFNAQSTKRQHENLTARPPLRVQDARSKVTLSTNRSEDPA